MGKYKGVFMDVKDIVTDYGNLYRAYKDAKRGKKYNGSRVRFQNMSLEGLHILKEQLTDQTYRMSPYNEFKIYEPKERVIESCSFKDKIVQHVFCDNVLHPVLKDVLIRTNYAGQIGKGTDFGRECLKEQMLIFYSQHGLDGWILKCDIRKFFYQIDHDVLKDIVDYYFTDEYSMWLNHLFIDSVPHLGLPLGNQTAQVHALLALDCVDHLITGELGIGLYGRYMDDFYLIHHDKEYLKFCLEHIRDMVSGLNLELNGKTQIVPFKNGLSFLGFHHYLTRDGKYIRKLKGEKKRAIKKKLTVWTRLVNTGEMPEENFWQKYNAFKNHALKGNCIKLCYELDRFVEDRLSFQRNLDN